MSQTTTPVAMRRLRRGVFVPSMRSVVFPSGIRPAPIWRALFARVVVEMGSVILEKIPVAVPLTVPEIVAVMRFVVLQKAVIHVRAIVVPARVHAAFRMGRRDVTMRWSPIAYVRWMRVVVWMNGIPPARSRQINVDRAPEIVASEKTALDVQTPL